MKRILILDSVMINGDPAPTGSVVEVADSDAQLLIGIGKAAIAPDPEPEPEHKSARSRKFATED